MSYLEKIETYLSKQKEDKDQVKAVDVTFETIPLMTLSEFSRRSMALEVYSEILGAKVWLCTNEEMASQIKKEDPEAVCYTIAELRHLISLKVSPEDIKGIHEAKAAFPKSKLVGSKLKEEV